MNFDNLNNEVDLDDENSKKESRFDKNNRVYLLNSGELDAETYALISRELFMVSVDARLKLNFSLLKDYFSKAYSYFMVLMNFMQFERLENKHLENYDNNILNLRTSGIYRVTQFYRELINDIENNFKTLQMDLNNDILYNLILKQIDLIYQSLELLRAEKIGIPSTRIKTSGSIRKTRIANIRHNNFGFDKGGK